MRYGGLDAVASLCVLAAVVLFYHNYIPKKVQDFSKSSTAAMYTLVVTRKER